MAKDGKDNNKVRPGIYQHYKGKTYRVIGDAKHTETREKLVVYQALYGKRELWIRPQKMFLELVKVNNQKVPRFKYLTDG